jgi:hypothetical protein
MLLKVAVLVVVCLIPASLLAQAYVDPAPAIEAVSRAEFMVGTWKGEGWAKMGPAPKEEFTQVETVDLMLDGAVLMIEGVGHSKGESPEKVHHALALLSYDPTDTSLVFSSFMAGRPRLDVTPEVGESTFDWGFSAPGGMQIRYSSVVKDDTWTEVGEYSMDGSEWHQFFEMTLKRQ